MPRRVPVRTPAGRRDALEQQLAGAGAGALGARQRKGEQPQPGGGHDAGDDQHEPPHPVGRAGGGARRRRVRAWEKISGLNSIQFAGHGFAAVKLQTNIFQRAVAPGVIVPIIAGFDKRGEFGDPDQFVAGSIT